MDFKNRVAVVTGGTGALGSAVTRDLLASGARVAVPYRREERWIRLKADAAQHGESLWGMNADLCRSDDVEGLVRDVLTRWGRIDFLVAVAGGFAVGKSYESSDEAWDHMLDINLRSLVHCLRSVIPLMVNRNFGRIVTISSGAILRGGGAGMAAYAVSKGAVRHLTELLAEEVRAYDIHVHCVMPGTMDTEANRRAMPKADFSKWVKTENVASVIHFLLGDDASAVRSVVVPVLG